MACNYVDFLGIKSESCGSSASRRSLENLKGQKIPMLDQYMRMRSKIDWAQMSRETPMAMDDEKEFARDQVCIYRNRTTSHKAAIGFLIPKVASSAFRVDGGLLANPNETSLATAGWQQHFCDLFFRSNPELVTDENVIRFAVVRDPASRFVSAFNEAKLEATATAGANPASKDLFSKLTDDPEAMFKKFMLDVLPSGNIHKVAWTEPQSVLLLQRVSVPPNGTEYRLPALDFLVSLDLLDVHTPELRSILGIPNDDHVDYRINAPPHQHRTQHDNHMSISYNVGMDLLHKQPPSITQSFCDLYAADFVLFGYDVLHGCSLSSKKKVPETWPEDTIRTKDGDVAPRRSSKDVPFGGHSRFLNKVAAQIWESHVQATSIE